MSKRWISQLHGTVALGFLLSLILWNHHETKRATTAGAMENWHKKDHSSSKECEAALPMLVDKLQEDPEWNALRPVTVDGYTFRGLDDSMLQASFQGRTIVFMGDSTVNSIASRLFPFQVVMQNQSLKEQFGFHKLPNLNLTQANRKPLRELNLPEEASNMDSSKLVQNKKQNVPDVKYINIVNAQPGRNNILQRAWETVKQIEAEVVVIGHGMHWLHFMGKGRLAQNHFIGDWLHHREWLQRIVESAVGIPSINLLLFKVVNRICDEKFKGEYASANKLFLSRDNETLETCRQISQDKLNYTLHKSGTKIQASPEELARYCELGTLNEVGASFLNQQIWEFYHSLVENPSNLLSLHNISFAVFNDHDIENCRYSREKDGRHFVNQSLTRIRLMGNMIDCLISSSHGDKPTAVESYG